MELTQNSLLTVLFIAIVANIILIVAAVLLARVRRRRMLEPLVGPSGIDRGLLAASRAGGSTYPVSADPWLMTAPVEDGDVVVADVAAAHVAAAHVAAADPWPSTRGATRMTDSTRTDEPTTTIGVDAPPGVLDGPAWSRILGDEAARIKRYHRPGTVVMIQLDGLDRFVDRLGHDAADRIVSVVADTILRLARDADHVARLGPGRFAVLLPETDEVAAINYVERARRSCELWLESGAIAMRLAIGWAGTTGDPDLAEAQRIATERMFIELRRSARFVGGSTPDDTSRPASTDGSRLASAG